MSNFTTANVSIGREHGLPFARPSSSIISPSNQNPVSRVESVTSPPVFGPIAELFGTPRLWKTDSKAYRGNCNVFFFNSSKEFWLDFSLLFCLY